MAARAVPLCPCRLRPMPFCSESSNGSDSLSERWRRVNERMKFESAVRRALQKVTEKGRLKDKMKCDRMAGQVLKNLADGKIPFPELNHRPLLENGDEARCERNGEDAAESGIERYDKKISSRGERVEEDNENLLKLASIYDKVLVVENVAVAREVVRMITTKYRDLIYACDTEVAGIDVKRRSPIDHGEIICFSIYPGSETDFRDGKSCIWVDVLDGGKDVLMEFSPFFEDSTIKKVWHNYSFDCHVIEKYGIKLSGFHADTMHLARLWDSSRRSDGGYSLEALTHDPKVMNKLHEGHIGDLVVGKISMKSLFGKKKMKRDGSAEKLVTLDPVETLQRRERIPWICYSALDSISTLKLFYSLREKLLEKEWVVGSKPGLTMYYFYEEYWRPFGVLLAKMESEGMLVDREYLSSKKEVAIADRQIAADVFRKWASKYCPDAKYMNVSSDIQIRQLFFGGALNRKDKNKSLPVSKAFKVHDTESGIVDKKTSKYRDITLHRLNMEMQTEMYTPSGWPSVTLDTLKEFAGKVPLDHIYFMGYEDGNESYGSEEISTDKSLIGENKTANSDVNLSSMYGTAYQAFGGGNKGREACHAIAALCEFRSIDSLLSNFILPLLGDQESGNYERIHCSLNINTETGRLSARRPNFQNQPALEKDRYKIRQAFVAEPGNSLIVADYGQLELRILAHLANCRSMLEAFKVGGDFHSRTAMNMHENILDDVREGNVLLEWEPKPGEEKPPVPLLKEIYAAERREAKMLNFSIAYGKTPVGLSQDWKVSVEEAKNKIELWYNDRKEVLKWQEECKRDVKDKGCVYTLLGRARHFPSFTNASLAQRHHMERSAINTPVQGGAADIAMCAMLEIDRNPRLKELRWRLIMQVHDELILEGPTESAEEAKKIIVTCMSKPFNGQNLLRVDLTVDAKCGKSWYEAK